ncbi:MAG: NADH:flavin oxidoreductase [Gemmatimonadetes bacterium]|nr:NADH:flavin oxidoreductase [Gemmatimonadota bacterium]
MRRDDYAVFSEGRIASLTTKNRFVRSATHEGGMTEEGKTTEGILELYRTLAGGGVGTIITGHVAVMREGQVNQRQICAYGEDHVAEMARIAEVVHAEDSGCRVVAQLNHGGRQVFHDNDFAECVGPSDVPSPILRKRARELRVEEIQVIIDCFVKGIERVRSAGFDGAQLHAAHGYLLSSFLSPYTNRRNDRYGGSLEGRVTILREIITKARERVGDFPILIKMNCDDHVEGGIDTATFPELARQVAGLGFDAIEVSGGMWDCLSRSEKELGFFPLPIPESRTRINIPEKQSYFLDHVEGLDIGVPLILVGGHRNIEVLEKIVASGVVGFLALSRPLISEPGLPNRWLQGLGRDQADCVSCNSCLLEVKYGPVRCLLKESKLKHKVVKSLVPRIWKLILK